LLKAGVIQKAETYEPEFQQTKSKKGALIIGVLAVLGVVGLLAGGVI